MDAFSFTRTPIDVPSLRQRLTDPAAGGYASFEGWVRNHNDGMPVRHLEYEAFEALAVKEGALIIEEAKQRFGIEHAACVHRIGDLTIGEMAVWVGASARHRHEAFVACRYIIDEVKHRVPIWKKEHYVNGDSGWVNCERCAATPEHQQAHVHEHGHTPQHVHEHGHAPQRAHVNPQSERHAADYSRQIALQEVGRAGQAKLRATRVLVVGCGGLGVPVISYLAGAGIGALGLVDRDRLEPSNLHRQTLYSLADVGQPKAELAAARARALNPEVDVRAYVTALDAATAKDLIAHHDLVIDCTDNFATKFLLNDYCVHLRKPAVFASVYQYEGQLQVIRPDIAGACLRCVWPEATRDGIVGNCAEAGVLGPVPGTFGALQALEAMKLLLGLPGQLQDEVLVLDLLTFATSRIRTRRSSSCPEHANSRVAQPQVAAGREADLEVSFETLDAAQQAGFEIVDIREVNELRETPLPFTGARHAPMAQLLYGQPAYAAGPKTLLVCASGRRSLAAAQELRSRGAMGVYSLRGGVAALQESVQS